MQRNILIGLFASIIANAYFAYERKFFELEMTSNIPYLEQPKKMFTYLDGYHHAVKSGASIVNELNIDDSRNPKRIPSNIYDEGLREGANDSQIISTKILNGDKAVKDFIQAQLDIYIKKNKKKDLIINQLTEQLAEDEMRWY